MLYPIEFIKDIMNYFSENYPYKLQECHCIGTGFVLEFLIPPCNDICAKYISLVAGKEIFSLWQSGELDKDRNKPLWQIEFENYLEGS